MDINQIKEQSKFNNLAVGVLVICGTVSLAASFQGRQTPLVEYCFKPENLTNPANAAHYCTPAQRYIMPEGQFNALTYEPTNPAYQSGWSLPAKATRLRSIPASNPYKWLWGVTATGFYGVAYSLSKARERKLIEYLPNYRSSVTQSWVFTKLAHWQQFRQESLEAFNLDRKRQYAADLDFQLWQFGADRAARAKQLSMLTPEEIAIFHEQARLRAVQEAQAQIHDATGQPQAQLPGQTLDEVTNPSDKVEGVETQQLENSHNLQDQNLQSLASLPTTYPWLNEFISNTSLILGSQGSGKSWIVRLLVLLKKLKGYRVIVLDPNSNRAEWVGVDFYGSYEEIQEQMQAYVDEIQERYKAFRESTMTEEAWRKKLWADGKALAVICEEYSTYSDFIEDEDLIKKFVKSAATLSRKQEAPVTFVTHNLTKECLGNVKGLFNIFERMQRLTLNTQTDPVTKQPMNAGTGTVKAVDSCEFREIKTPKLKEKIRDFRSEPDRVSDTRSFLEKQFRHPELDEPLTPPQGGEIPLTEKQNAVLNYLRANGARTLKQIADSRRLGLPETREIVNELIQRELVDLDGELYRLTNT